MQRIPISFARPGMLLAKDLVRPENPTGPAICGKGMELTDSLLERLRNMGIQSLTVQGNPVWMEGDKTLEELLQELNHRFSHVDQDPLTSCLKDVYRKYLISSMGE
ncbi:MAG: hypothetical protein AB9919_08870 [Geobacteraceae bacterium]